MAFQYAIVVGNRLSADITPEFGEYLNFWIWTKLNGAMCQVRSLIYVGNPVSRKATVEWKIVNFTKDQFNPIKITQGLIGWMPSIPKSEDFSIDYLRSDFIQWKPKTILGVISSKQKLTSQIPTTKDTGITPAVKSIKIPDFSIAWRRGTAESAVKAFDKFKIAAPKIDVPSEDDFGKVLIYGDTSELISQQRITRVGQNQGWKDNTEAPTKDFGEKYNDTFRDGCVLIRLTDTKYRGFFIRSVNQATKTNDTTGEPIPQQ